LAPLMARVGAGDHEAFARVYDATARNIFGIVFHVLRDRAQAEEVTQEVYVEAWRLAKRFDSSQGSVSAWLNTMAHRRAVDRVRSSERRSLREQRHADDQLTKVGPDPSDQVVANDEGRRVRAALAQLPERQRTAVELAYFEGKTQREVAELLQVPLGTVKTRIRDAMQRLRRNLGEATI
nr:sigma-70 family RNA polymerase sigma factor [Propionibacteriales bacterium]